MARATKAASWPTQAQKMPSPSRCASVPPPGVKRVSGSTPWPPGAVETPLLQAGLHDARYAQAIKNFVAPLGRRADPSEIAAAVAFLLSPQASFIHGTQLFIDGGMDAMVRPTQF